MSASGVAWLRRKMEYEGAVMYRCKWLHQRRVREDAIAHAVHILSRHAHGYTRLDIISF